MMKSCLLPGSIVFVVTCITCVQLSTHSVDVVYSKSHYLHFGKCVTSEKHGFIASEIANSRNAFNRIEKFLFGTEILSKVCLLT